MFLRAFQLAALSLVLTGPSLAQTTTAPTQAELDAADTDPASWLTYNKGYLGYRFSPLKTITAANVGSVKVLCQANLGQQGRFESGIIAYNGVLYVTNALETWAIDAGTCNVLWSYTYVPGAGVKATGPSNRGVAIEAGRLFWGTGDGHLIALDVATGALLWNQQIMDQSVGETAVAAPIAWNGLVFMAKAGGDKGIQGEVMAFKQTDGSKVWGFNTIPDPGAIGSNTWPSAFSIAHGGGAVWTTFTLDEARTLLMFPVGNPGPAENKSLRKGANLFSASIVALNAQTGALSWWHQLIKSDYHDWDTTLTAAIPGSGSLDLALAAGKDGVLHAVDRSDGKLRYTVPLVENYQNTTTPLNKAGATVHLCPVHAEGWNGPSYSPATKLVYSAGIDWCTTAIQGPPPTYMVDKGYAGWANGEGGTSDPISSAFGLISAIDASTGALVWRTQLPLQASLPALPLGGIVATAGGLVITGGIDGYLDFMDASSGSVLRALNLGQPIGGGIISFEAGGAQRLAVAGGMTSSDYQTTGTATVYVLGPS